MRVKIISDSTCDLSPALLERYDIAVTPLCVIKDGKDFHDGVDITPADIFAHVDGGGDLCSTSAVSQYEYGEMFARYANEYDAVVQITIGANFSCCYQNACAAAQEYENVFVVDSENLSTGQGLLVVAAAKLAEQGLSGAEIAERVRALAPKVEASFLIERLDYMRKGGRCSAVAALGANLLHLKPCIEVRNGKMAVCKKYRGSFEKCIRQYVKERLDGREDIAPELAFITHAAAHITSESRIASTAKVRDRAFMEKPPCLFVFRTFEQQRRARGTGRDAEQQKNATAVDADHRRSADLRGNGRDKDRQNAIDDQRGRAAEAENEAQKPHRPVLLLRFGGRGIRRTVF